MLKWQEYTNKLESLMALLSVQDPAGKELGADAGFIKLKQMTADIRQAGQTIFLVGNGASASMASHFATDLMKNAGINSEVFFELSLLTAIANDVSYEESFSLPLELKIKKGDMLVAISSSGNSPNVVKAVRKSRELGGIPITFSAMQADNKIRSMGDLSFYVQADTYGNAETCHAAMLHYWIDSLIETEGS